MLSTGRDWRGTLNSVPTVQTLAMSNREALHIPHRRDMHFLNAIPATDSDVMVIGLCFGKICREGS